MAGDDAGVRHRRMFMTQVRPSMVGWRHFMATAPDRQAFADRNATTLDAMPWWIRVSRSFARSPSSRVPLKMLFTCLISNNSKAVANAHAHLRQRNGDSGYAENAFQIFLATDHSPLCRLQQVNTTSGRYADSPPNQRITPVKLDGGSSLDDHFFRQQWPSCRRTYQSSHAYRPRRKRIIS